MNGHDVTGGSDFKFSEPVNLSAVDGASGKDITDKLVDLGFSNAHPGSGEIMHKIVDTIITYIIKRGDPETSGSYAGKVRSADGDVTKSQVDDMIGLLEGTLEPYNG